MRRTVPSSMHRANQVLKHIEIHQVPHRPRRHSVVTDMFPNSEIPVEDLKPASVTHSQRS